jgi:hypothetical protein
VIVDRDIRGVVVTHHAGWIPVLDTAARERVSEARDEAVHRSAADLQVDRAGGVIGIIGDRRAAQMVHGIAAPVVLVGELRTQAIDIAAGTLKRQISEHVIKRAVFEHQHDDVVDLLQVGHGALLRIGARAQAPPRAAGALGWMKLHVPERRMPYPTRPRPLSGL